MRAYHILVLYQHISAPLAYTWWYNFRQTNANVSQKKIAVSIHFLRGRFHPLATLDPFRQSLETKYQGVLIHRISDAQTSLARIPGSQTAPEDLLEKGEHFPASRFWIVSRRETNRENSLKYNEEILQKLENEIDYSLSVASFEMWDVSSRVILHLGISWVLEFGNYNGGQSNWKKRLYTNHIKPPIQRTPKPS